MYFFAERSHKMSLIRGKTRKMYVSQGENAQNVSYNRGQRGKYIFCRATTHEIYLIPGKRGEMYLFRGEAAHTAS